MKSFRVVLLASSMGLLLHAPAHKARAQEFAMSTETDSVQTLMRFDTSGSADRWFAVNDNVMGGISEGGPAITEDGHLLFTGSLSLENNGGFASIRTRPSNLDLSEYEGIRIRVKGDGRVYQFRLRLNNRLDGIAFKHEFQTTANTWMDIDMPFDSFVPSYRGRILADAGSMKASDIKQMAFMIADKTEGPFRLLIEEINAYK